MHTSMSVAARSTTMTARSSFACCARGRLDRFHVLAADRRDDRGAVGEVAIERRLPDPGAAADLVHRDIPARGGRSRAAPRIASRLRAASLRSGGCRRVRRGRHSPHTIRTMMYIYSCRGPAPNGHDGRASLAWHPARRARRDAMTAEARESQSERHARGAGAGRARLRDAERGGDPGAADDPARPAHHRDGGHVGAHRLPARGLGRHRRSSAASATCTARSACCCGRSMVLARRHAARGGRAARWTVIVCARAPGRGRRHLPARVRDRPRRVPARAGSPGSIGLLSAILGVGGGVGIVLVRRDHRAPQLPLAVLDPARRRSRRGGARDLALVPESPVRVPGRVNWRAATLMTVGISAVLLAVSETTTWGWGSAKTLGLLAGGLAGLRRAGSRSRCAAPTRWST